MSISLAYAGKTTAIETLAGEFVDPSDATVTVNGTNTEQTLTASTTPPVTKQSSGTLALSAGAGTIDLTSLPDLNGVAAAVTFDGLKLATVRFVNPSTNANVMTIAKGASNGHTGLGAAFSIAIQPGAEFQWMGFNNGADVAAGDKTFDVTGTGAQELQYHLTAG